MNNTLSYKKIEPQGSFQNIVIFLHGYGANCDDLLSIGKLWEHTLPKTLFISPNAPFKCSWGGDSYQWFDLTSVAPEKIGEGIKKAGPYLNGFIDNIIKKYGVSMEKIVFVSFSQGTMMALYHLCKRQNACAGLLGYSGLLYEDEAFAEEISCSFPIKLFHGYDDEVINFEYTIKAYKKLKSLNFFVTHQIENGLAHGISRNGMDDGLKFIKQKLYI